MNHTTEVIKQLEKKFNDQIEHGQYVTADKERRRTRTRAALSRVKAALRLGWKGDPTKATEKTHSRAATFESSPARRKSSTVSKLKGFMAKRTSASSASINKSESDHSLGGKGGDGGLDENEWKMWGMNGSTASTSSIQLFKIVKVVASRTKPHSI